MKQKSVCVIPVKILLMYRFTMIFLSPVYCGILQHHYTMSRPKRQRLEKLWLLYLTQSH